MRLLHTFTNIDHAKRFASYLQHVSIAFQLESNKVSDWGSERYGDFNCLLWIVDEDEMEKASCLLTEFLKDPDNTKFTSDIPNATTKLITPSSNEQKQMPKRGVKGPRLVIRKHTLTATAPLTGITLLLLISCVLLFIWSSFTQPKAPQVPLNIPYAALYASPIEKELMFDYPKTFSLIDRILKSYGTSAFTNPSSLSASGLQLMETLMKTPYWKGIYPLIIYHIHHPDAPWQIHASLFEKERQGELYRLFTPALLHNGIFHLLFNMVWLIVLGRQIEARLGTFRYLILIVLSAIISNTAQYLMTGPNFIGFSGVVCGMIAFIWVRLHNNPWEGYLLHPSTRAFVLFFVLILTLLSLLSFLAEVLGYPQFGPNIANTAHIVGAIVGALLALSRFFAAKT